MRQLKRKTWGSIDEKPLKPRGRTEEKNRDLNMINGKTKNIKITKRDKI